MTKERYGFTETEVSAFQQRWNRSIGQDCTWSSFNDFLEWAGTADYAKGARLRKIDESRPFGPDNAYFYKGRILTVKESADQNKPKVCQNCVEETTYCASYGCAMWKEWFVKNWNDNIHVYIPKHMRLAKKTVFRYEHPDRVRGRSYVNQSGNDGGRNERLPLLPQGKENPSVGEKSLQIMARSVLFAIEPDPNEKDKYIIADHNHADDLMEMAGIYAE